jgi:hypothetical protein
MLGLGMLGLAALGLGGRRRIGAGPSGGSGEAPPAGRFLAEPFFFCKE